MSRTTKTIDLKGKNYAEVKERIKEFRADCPNGLIETTPTIQPDGSILFKARILKDKAEPSSGEASGHALGANKGEKAFEKLETIAVGRALALLGYSADGEIASSEEMEEFMHFQEEKKLSRIEEDTKALEAVKTLGELKTVWGNLPIESKNALESLKNELKAKLTPATNENA